MLWALLPFAVAARQSSMQARPICLGVVASIEVKAANQTTRQRPAGNAYNMSSYVPLALLLGSFRPARSYREFEIYILNWRCTSASCCWGQQNRLVRANVVRMHRANASSVMWDSAVKLKLLDVTTRRTPFSMSIYLCLVSMIAITRRATRSLSSWLCWTLSNNNEVP